MLLIILGVMVVAGNVLLLWSSYRDRRFRSLIPLVGGGSMSFGMLLIPTLRPWAWVPLLLDPGSAWMIGGALFLLPWRYYHHRNADRDDE